MTDDLYTPAEAARYLKAARRTVLEWLRRGDLKGVKVGGQWRIKGAAIEAFLKPHDTRPFTAVDDAIASGGLCTRMADMDQAERDREGRPSMPPHPTD